MLERLLARLSQRVSPDTYRGARVAFVPLDAALSLMAKRNRFAYDLWCAYSAATDPFFHAPLAHDPPGLVAELRQQGYSTVPSAYDPGLVRAARQYWLARYLPTVKERDERDPTGKAPEVGWRLDAGLSVKHFRATGRTRFFIDPSFVDSREAPELVRVFRDDPRSRAVAEAYFGVGTVRDREPYLMAEILEPAPAIEDWHLDCIRSTLKAFLLLDDCTDESGPLRYAPGSQRIDDSRHDMFFRICQAGLDAAYATPSEAARLDQRAHAITGTAGTLVYFDNRGLHASTHCQSGLRVVMVNGYRPIGATRVNPRMFEDPDSVTLEVR